MTTTSKELLLQFAKVAGDIDESKGGRLAWAWRLVEEARRYQREEDAKLCITEAESAESANIGTTDLYLEGRMDCAHYLARVIKES